MRKIVVSALMVCLILAALHFQPVRAADLYVDDTGTDSGNCQTSPCRTIGYAVGQAVDDDTIHVAAGTYDTESFPIYINKDVTLIGAGAATTIIDGVTDEDVIQIGDVTVNIRGFTITGGSDGIETDYSEGTIEDNIITGNDGEGIEIDDSSLTIRDNTISYNDHEGIEADEADVTIEGNTVENNDQDGIDVDDSDITIRDNTVSNNGEDESGNGIYVQDSDDCTIEGNTVENNEDDGIDGEDTGCTISANFSSGNGSDGIELDYYGGERMPPLLAEEQENGEEELDEDDEEEPRGILAQGNGYEIIIVNNVIVSNEDDGIDIDADYEVTFIITNNTIAYNNGEGSDGIEHSGPSSPEITNNIIAFNGDDGIDDSSDSTTINTYNDVFGNDDEDYEDDATPGVGSISADPLFMGEANFHLSCISPAMNAGNNSAPEISNVDFDGEARIQDGIVDMGAYEGCPKKAPMSEKNPIPSLLPTSQNNISKGRDLVMQTEDLLSEAKAKGLDTTQCEKLIDEAKGLLEKAKKSLTNPIYANNLALKAIEKLKDAIDCLKALLG